MSKERAPQCSQRIGVYQLQCERRTLHESGRCPQHRRNRNGRGQPPRGERS